MILRRVIAHSIRRQWTAAGQFAERYSAHAKPIGIIAMLCAGCAGMDEKAAIAPPYITSPTALRIVSANDGDALTSVSGTQRRLPDSVTVIDLSPDAPPVTRTVSGTVPNSYSGAPISAIVADGRYAFIPNHPFGLRDNPGAIKSQVSVVNLDAADLPVIATFDLPHHAWQVMAHPDGVRVIAASDHRFHIFKVDAGLPKLIAESGPFGGYLISFAISPDGRSILATAAERLDYSTPVELHLFMLEGDAIRHATRIGIDPELGEIDQPFAPRFSPDGARALVLNGLGIAAQPPLDAILSIDMTANPPSVTEAIPDVAQGLESLAFHPSGRFAVVTCIDGPYIGHLAVIDLTAPSMRLLYYLPIEYVPQGIEFSPDGSMLFVQSTTAGHISVYDVEELHLRRRPYVLRTGEGPATMALSPRGATP